MRSGEKHTRRTFAKLSTSFSRLHDFPPKGLPKMTRRRILIAILAIVFGYAFNFGARASHAHRPRISEITNLLRQYGLPDRVEILKHGSRAYRWKFKATAAFGDSDDDRRLEDFYCTVTAVTSPSGKITKLSTDVADVGAGILAAAGSFGAPCSKNLRPKSLGTPPDRTLQRMRR